MLRALLLTGKLCDLFINYKTTSMLKQDNTAVRLLPEKMKEEKVSDERLRSKQALKVVKKEKEQKEAPAILMPPQEKGYIKPPRYDFF